MPNGQRPRKGGGRRRGTTKEGVSDMKRIGQMDGDKRLVAYLCLKAGCTESFVAKQGSRRRYCDACREKSRKALPGRPRKQQMVLV